MGDFEKVEKNNKTSKKLNIIIAVLVLLILATGVSYAQWQYNFIGQLTSTISTDSVELKFLESQDNVINITNALPLSDEEGKQEDTFDFAVTSKTKKDTNIGYTLSIEKLTPDNGYTFLDDQDIKIYLEDYEENELLSPTKISNLEDYKFYSNLHEHSTSNDEIQDKYKLRVWIDEAKTNDAKNWDTSTKLQYKFKINVISEEVENPITVTFDEGNLLKNVNKNIDGLQVTYDEDTQILTLNGTSTSNAASINLVLYNNIEFNEGDKYRISKEYISGEATGTGVVTISGEIDKINGNSLSPRNYVDIYYDKNNYDKNLTVSSVAASEGKLLSLFLWFENRVKSYTFNNFKVKVTYSKISSKKVAYHNQYGQLPTPTREGYTFKGWNGKNKFNKLNYLKTEDYYEVSNSIYKASNIYLKPNTNYFISIIRHNGFDGTGHYYLLISHSNLINDYWTAIAHNTTPDISWTDYKFLTKNDGLLYIGYYATSQRDLDIIWENTDIQLEEGTQATEYEPYYITSSTKVVQNTNHTLKAIWEPNS